MLPHLSGKNDSKADSIINKSDFPYLFGFQIYTPLQKLLFVSDLFRFVSLFDSFKMAQIALDDFLNRVRFSDSSRRTVDRID